MTEEQNTAVPEASAAASAAPNGLWQKAKRVVRAILRRGKRFGSDHLPLIFDFIVPQAKENPAAPATAA